MTVGPPGLYGVGYESAPPGAQALLQTTVAPGTYSLYTRARFTVAEAAQVTSLFLGCVLDDGVVAWVNGVEVWRSPQMPAGTPAWNTNASSHQSSNGSVPNYGSLVDVTLCHGAAGAPRRGGTSSPSGSGTPALPARAISSSCRSW